MTKINYCIMPRTFLFILWLSQIHHPVFSQNERNVLSDEIIYKTVYADILPDATALNNLGIGIELASKAKNQH